MPTDPTNITALLIGGGLTLAGTFVSQVTGLFAGWVDRKHKAQIVRRERFEELADCLSKTTLWFPKISACKTIDEIKACGPPIEARRMFILASLYFPEMKDGVINYVNGLNEHYGWMCDCFSPNIPASAGAQAVMTGNREQDKKILALRNNLDLQLGQFARKYAAV